MGIYDLSFRLFLIKKTIKEGSNLNEVTPLDHQGHLAVVDKPYKPLVFPHLTVSGNQVLKLHVIC